MRRTFDPFRLLLISVAGWSGQQQRDAIDYLREENRVLREQLGNKRLRLNDDQRRRDAGGGFLTGKRYLIHDRDPLFTAEFLGTLAASGVKSVKLRPQSPNLNAHAERFVRTIKESCLDRMILFGEGSLRKTIREFMAHYQGERNHQRGKASGADRMITINRTAIVVMPGQPFVDWIFEEQLDGWYRVPRLWPSRRDLDVFDRWFECSFHSVVVDLCDDPLLQEEIWPARAL